ILPVAGGLHSCLKMFLVPCPGSRVPGFGTNCCTRSTGQEERRCYRILLHTFIQSCLFFLHISPLFISPLFLYLPRTLGLSLFYTLSSHPRTAGHATSPGTQLQLIRAAGANLHQIGFTCILVHLRSTQDVCVLYEEVRCKSYDLAAVPGAFGTAATPAPHISV
ncbi:mCG1034377, partial [Mus musculus]